MEAPRSPFYRSYLADAGLSSFQVKWKETDLWVAVDRGNYRPSLPKELKKLIAQWREELERFGEEHPEFFYALEPLPLPRGAPPLAVSMAEAAYAANVGPMAAVAGVFAQKAGEQLLEMGAKEAVVENGGDIYMQVGNLKRVGIYAGSSPLSGKIGLEVDPEKTPVGICTSSGTIGHAFSRGNADAVLVLSPSPPLADAAATALGNRVEGEEGLQEVVAEAGKIKGVSGALIICRDKMAVWGDFKLCALNF